MTTQEMIRALENVAEKYKDRPVYTGETNIPLMCRDVINRLKELLCPWHTEKPTKEGCYIVYYWDDHNPLGVTYEAMCDVMVQPVFNDDGELECWINDDRGVRFEADDIIRWQRIEPHKEET